MKKLLSIAIAGLSLASAAAPEKLVEVTIADQTTLVNQATMLGEQARFPMFGMMAVSSIAQNPLATLFGAPRPDAPFLITLAGDPSLLPADLDNDEALAKFGESIRYTVLYPCDPGTKADFLAKFTSAIETNGVICVDGTEYAAFSADGKWVANGNCEKGVKCALSRAATLAVKNGEAVRIAGTEAGYALLSKVVDGIAAEAKKEGEVLPPQFAVAAGYVKAIKDGFFAVRVSKLGIDFGGEIAARPGTELASLGNTPLASDALAFAGNDFMAAAAAPKSGAYDYAPLITEGLKIAEKHGVKTHWLTTQTLGAATKFALDVKALVDYAKGEGSKLDYTLDKDALEKDLASLAANFYKPTEKAVACSFTLKGAGSTSSVAQRYAKAMPDFSLSSTYTAGVCSFYGFARALADQIIPIIKADDPATADQISMMISSLPAPGDGCMAFASAKSGDVHKMLFRITPEETGNLVTAYMSVVMQAFAGGGMVGNEELGDEVEELDDED